MRRIYRVGLMALLPMNALAIPADPLNSVQWTTMYNRFLKDYPVQFDSRVQVLAPEQAENSMQVPLAVKVEGLQAIEEILIFADFNPLPKVLSFYPQQALPFIGFRIKLQQASPIRAAVRTADGWHVGGKWVDAAGGGCTLPSAARNSGVWESQLGQVQGRIWQQPNAQRVRFRVIHPMDTGLAAGIPKFQLEQINLQDATGKTLAQIKPAEPVSENPIFSIEFPKNLPLPTLHISGRDNNANKTKAELIP